MSTKKDEKDPQHTASDPAGNRKSVEKAPGPKGPEGTDPTVGEEKIDESADPGAIVAAGGGSEVFAGHPLIKGIPVVVPVNETAGFDPKKLVYGLAVAAAVVPGAPEMVANAQAVQSVDEQDWKEGDVKGIHDVPGGGEVVIDRVGDDGVVRAERHRTDKKTYGEFEKAFQDPKNWKRDAKAFYKKNFGKDTLIGEPE